MNRQFKSPILQHKISHAMEAVEIELNYALEKAAPMRSPHEGFAVLKEEVDELWDVVKEKPDAENRRGRMYLEARQVAAMALRFMVEVAM